MSLLIQNGRIVTATRRFCRRRAGRGRDDRRRRPARGGAGRRRGGRRRRASSCSPGSSTRTCTSTCRSWARTPRTLRLGQPGGAGRRHDDAHRNVLPGPQRRSAGGVRAVAVQGRRAARATTRFTWACRGSTRRPTAAIREIAARGIASLKVFLAYKGAFGIDDGELFNTLTLAKELGADRHRPLRERNARGRAAAAAARRGQDGPRVARAVAAAAGRGRGRAPPDDVRRADRRPRVLRPHLVPRGARGGRRPPGCAACRRGSRR